ncbi:MAG: cation transporter [Butyrivibrio sp.]|nr:cation transporter [Butyrivibrio sp.]
MSNEGKRNELEKQHNVALLLILWRLPEFITSFVAAAASGSAVVWLEFIESASILIPGVLIAVFSKRLNKNLKYVYNYGTGKVEAITALSCEIFDIAGLFCVVFFSVRTIIKPEPESGYIFLALIISIIGLFIDMLILFLQSKILLGSQSKMFHTAYISARKEFFFDAVAIITLVIELLFEKTTWISYLSPIVCIIIAVPFFMIVLSHMKASISELIDRTLDEESQLKILKVLNEFFDSYEELGDIRTRINGEDQIVDIELKFHETMDYGSIRDIAEKIKVRVQEELGRSTVNILVI